MKWLKNAMNITVYIFSIIGFISMMLFFFGYRPIHVSDTYPEWMVIQIMATIVLGVLTLIITIRISGIESRSQQKQTKLAVFELRYGIYERLSSIFTFIDLLKNEKNVIEKIRIENYLVWFDENVENHQMAINRILKSSLLFNDILSSRILLVSSASQKLFILLGDVYGCSLNHSSISEWESEITEIFDQICKHREVIIREIEELITLEEV